MTKSSVGHLPAKEKWGFDQSVTEVFDDMLERSIPQFGEMRKLCLELARAYEREDADVVDVGCSRGGAMAALIDNGAPARKYLGLEVSEPMLEAARARFGSGHYQDKVEVRAWDLRQGYPQDVQVAVTLAVLTVQFTPLEHRLRILRDIWASMVEGAALIFVEKVIGATAELDRKMVQIYYDRKRENGYSEDEIERKRLSLEGKLVPLTAQWNEEALTHTGFRQVDCFWRWMNFAGWIAIK